MKKRIAVWCAVWILCAGVFSTGAGAADVLKGTWANLTGTVMYVFDGKGGGIMSHAAHNHKITYTAKDGKLKITFPDNDGHGLSESFSFTVEGEVLKLTAEGKTAPLRYEKKPDGWTRPEKPTLPLPRTTVSAPPQESKTAPGNFGRLMSGDMLLGLLAGGAGGALLGIVIAVIFIKKKTRRERAHAKNRWTE